MAAGYPSWNGRCIFLIATVSTTDRLAIVEMLREIAVLLEAQHGNKFKVRAYKRGARALESAKLPVDRLIEEKKLIELPGIGRALALQIEEMHQTGKSELLEQLRAGATIAPTRKEKAAASEKTAYPIRLYDGLRLHSALRTDLSRIARVELAGSVREGIEMSPALDLVVVTDDPAAVRERLRFGTTVEDADSELRLRLADNTELHFVFTDAAGEDETIARWTRPDVLARERTSKLITQDDIRGFVHCHSTWSDGDASIEEMALAAQDLGAEFITITDHSKNAFYAGGLDVERLKKQWDEIDEVQAKVDIRILKGTEADILADGAIDWPDHVLEKLDVIVASIHNRYKQNEDAMTERVLRAVRWPGFKIWGHPLGRLVPSRPPIPLRVEEVLDAIAESECAVEINGDPMRMDLEPRWVLAARERKLPFVLSVDAHSTGNLDFLRTAVALARRAGVTKSEVLNTRHVAAFAKAVRPV